VTNLTLSIDNLDNPQNPKIEDITIEQGLITIGRGIHNHLHLDDPQKMISGIHATISYQGGQILVTDKSANGLFLNESQSPIGRGNSINIDSGNYLRIGSYKITLSITDSQPTALASNPLRHTKQSEYNKTVTGLSPALTPTPPPFPENPFSKEVEPFPRAAPPSDKEQSNNSDPFRDFPSPSLPIDTDTDANDPSFPDWPDWPDNDNESKEKSPSPAIEKPNPISKPVSENEHRSEYGSEHGNGNWDDAISYFLQGAGLDEQTLSQQITPKSFYTIGQMLSASIHGTKEVLTSRAKIKSEIRSNATMLVRESNNPIKQTRNSKEALQMLLSPTQPGYLPADQAIAEAFENIKSHQIAVMAGMQQALLSVLKRLSPEDLNKRLEQHNPISANIPIHKEAKLWGSYVQRYEDLIQEANDDFNRTFGEDFREAYEQQEKILKNRSE